MRKVMVLMACLWSTASLAWAQDPTKVDAKHYKVEFENAQVRVLRVVYGPGEKSPMHEHPGHVFVFLTDGQFTFAMQDGKSQDLGASKAGQTGWAEKVIHAPQNVGSKPAELLLVEVKRSGAAKK